MTDASPPRRSAGTEAMLRRLDGVERNQTDQARTLTAYNDEFKAIRERVSELEREHQDRRVLDAGEAAEAKALRTDIATMKEDIKSIKGIGSKALWVFISAIILAFAGFVIKGGLS